MRRSVFSLALLLALSLSRAEPPALAQTPATAIDVHAIGPRVGEAVADFALQDQTGRSRTLTSLLGPRGLMLVFFRSADW